METSNRTSVLFTEVGQLIKSRLQSSIALPFSQYQTLWFIGGRTRANMQEVAQYFKIRAPSATFLIEELVRAGLVARHTNSLDRRKVEVSLTPQGKKMFKKVEEKRSEILGALFGSLEPSDRKELERILLKVIDCDKKVSNN